MHRKRLSQPGPNQRHGLSRSRDAVARFLVENVKNIFRIRESNGVNRAVALPALMSSHFKNARVSETLERTSVIMLFAVLGQKKRVTEIVLNRLRAFQQVPPR
jgi:hypothetical protein